MFSHRTPLFRHLCDIDSRLQENKVVNLSIAVSKLHGILLEPGKTLSYWKCIGYPSAIRGFKKGVVLVNGVATERVGGGLCQLSNLLYWMTVHTPLSVVERYRHSFDVFPDQNRTQPFGSGATCVYNYRDLQIKNETDQSFLLDLSIHDGELWGSWHCAHTINDTYEVYERSHWITQEMPGLYVRHNILGRRRYSLNSTHVRELRDDILLTENHAIMMYSPLISAPTSFCDTGSL